jgi:beta-phosphoglucomutase-like phosphatase (HAD superfamily)
MLSTSTTSITPAPPYTALIFDCDGTLADTLPVHFQTWSVTLKSFGVDLTEEWFYKHCATSAVEMIQLLNTLFDYQLDTGLVNIDRQRRYQSLIQTIKEIQAVAEIVRTNSILLG